MSHRGLHRPNSGRRSSRLRHKVPGISMIQGAYRPLVACSAANRQSVEEFYHPGLERVFGAHDQQLIFLDQLLEDLRSMSQMICRGLNIRPNGVLHQSVRVTSRLCLEHGLYRWTNTVDD